MLLLPSTDELVHTVARSVFLLSQPLERRSLVDILRNWTFSDTQNFEWHYSSCNWVLQHLGDEERSRQKSLQSPLACSKRRPPLTSNAATMATLQRQPQSLCAATLRFNLWSPTVPDFGKQIKVSFMTSRCWNTKFTPFLLHRRKRENRKGEKKRTTRSSPKFLYQQILYPGWWQSILTPGCRKRSYRAKDGKDTR